MFLKIVAARGSVWQIRATGNLPSGCSASQQRHFVHVWHQTSSVDDSQTAVIMHELVSRNFDLEPPSFGMTPTFSRRGKSTSNLPSRPYSAGPPNSASTTHSFIGKLGARRNEYFGIATGANATCRTIQNGPHSAANISSTPRAVIKITTESARRASWIGGSRAMGRAKPKSNAAARHIIRKATWLPFLHGIRVFGFDRLNYKRESTKGIHPCMSPFILVIPMVAVTFGFAKLLTPVLPLQHCT